MRKAYRDISGDGFRNRSRRRGSAYRRGGRSRWTNRSWGLFFCMVIVIAGCSLVFSDKVDIRGLMEDGFESGYKSILNLDFESFSLVGKKLIDNVISTNKSEESGDLAGSDGDNGIGGSGVHANRNDSSSNQGTAGELSGDMEKADSTGVDNSEGQNFGFIEKLVSYAVAGGQISTASVDEMSYEGEGTAGLNDANGQSPGKYQVVSSVVNTDAMNQIGNAVQTQNTAPVVSDIWGAVFIYHTHATESYEPYNYGNYHITDEEGSVRCVGNALEEGLKAKGIGVYHDKTLHDHPSYTHSYGRSLETAQNYTTQHPDIRVMVDLHRDAMPASGKKYPVVNTSQGKAVSFNIVVGNKNPNFKQLLDFANRVINKANELYPGLGGRVIEREYKFNQFLSHNYMLVEVGNNGNNIEEARLTGRLLADVLEAVMRESQ